MGCRMYLTTAPMTSTPFKETPTATQRVMLAIRTMTTMASRTTPPITAPVEVQPIGVRHRTLTTQQTPLTGTETAAKTMSRTTTWTTTALTTSTTSALVPPTNRRGQTGFLMKSVMLMVMDVEISTKIPMMTVMVFQIPETIARPWLETQPLERKVVWTPTVTDGQTISTTAPPNTEIPPWLAKTPAPTWMGTVGPMSMTPLTRTQPNGRTQMATVTATTPPVAHRMNAHRWQEHPPPTDLAVSIQTGMVIPTQTVSGTPSTALMPSLTMRRNGLISTGMDTATTTPTPLGTTEIHPGRAYTERTLFCKMLVRPKRALLGKTA